MLKYQYENQYLYQYRLYFCESHSDVLVNRQRGKQSNSWLEVLKQDLKKYKKFRRHNEIMVTPNVWQTLIFRIIFPHRPLNILNQSNSQTSMFFGYSTPPTPPPPSPRRQGIKDNFNFDQNVTCKRHGIVVEVSTQGGTSILGGRGAWPQILPLKFLLEPQILRPKI